ncbi:hypothetical protein PybrP1_007513 [[Pythium] brassicae (nom. inval.)]|nr:hypothetical protein PybrP1_007513 [[Pythium] brassicae (nom. inval.)]
MGNALFVCGFSSVNPQSTFYRAYRTNEAMMTKLKGVGLDQKHLYALHQIFSAMDKDNSGEINMGEFFTYIDLARSRFSEKAFSIMDKDESGEVDFIEFVLAVWNYCSFSHASLVRFAFDIYDLDGSGEIEHAEVLRCVREVWGGAWEDSSSAQKIVAKLDMIMHATASGKLSVQKFQEFALRHPILLFPAFQLQTEMQKKVLGEKFWLHVAKKRGGVNPRDLNWVNVQMLSKMSKQTSSKFLQALEDDLGEQIANHLSTKPEIGGRRL